MKALTMRRPENDKSLSLI